jgi:3-hydroxybutyryl-CoA dehydrogenase
MYASPRRLKLKVQDIKKIAVIGSGTMGPGISLDFAKGGYDVCLCARRQASIDQAKTVIHENLLTLAKNDVVKSEDIPVIEARVSYKLVVEEAASDADFIIECINEKKDLKIELLKQLDACAKPDAIFGSNTSYLNIFELVPENRAANTVVAHWFAPAHILPLVEVVREARVSKETEETVLGLLRKIGKTPILMQKYVPGHAVNRLQRILGREIFYLLDNGYITADQLDLAVKASIAPRMCTLGLVQRYDFTGLDLSAGNLRLANYPEPPIDNAPKSLVEKVEKGDLGVKSGKGFFDYTDKSLEENLAKRDDDLIRVLKATEFALKDQPKLA